MNKNIHILKLHFKKYEVIIASILVILTTLILSFIFLMPNFKKSSEIFSQQKKLRNRLSVIKKKYDLLNSIDSKVYQNILPRLNQILPSSKDYVSLFSTFDDLQLKTGVTILKTDFQLGIISTSSANLSNTSSSIVNNIPLTIDVSGDLLQIQDFLKSLSSLDGRLMTVKEIRWGYDLGNQIILSLTGFTYFYPVGDKIGGIDTPLLTFDKNQENIFNIISEKPLIDETEETTILETGKLNLFN